MLSNMGAKSDRERDATAESRDLNVLQDPAFGQLGGEPASPRGPPLARVVRVSVLGRPLALPEHALCDGLSHLALATEGYVGLQDYAEAVALTLGVLARYGIVAFLA
jgi:hypothetical protein